ncbi:MAG: hypothetical protein JWP11_36 [Frankiales bacterium]|nr:hypothetical protein [Frankiales bacterium]
MTTPVTPGLTGHAQHQFLAKILDVEGYWAAFTGGEPSISVGEMYDGGAQVPDLIPSRGTVGNITLRRSFKPERDMPIRAELNAALRTGYVKPIVLQPTDRSGKAAGAKDLHPGCILLRVGTPQADANSDTGSSYELEFRSPQLLVQ